MRFWRLSLFLFLVTTTSAWGIDTSVRGDAQFTADHRWVPAPGLTRHSSLFDGIFIGGIDVMASQSGWAFEVRPELRALWSEAAESSASSADFIPLRSPPRWMDLASSLSDTNRTQAILDFEKLAFSYRDSEMELVVGRRIFSAGVLKLFPVWNKFSRPMPFLPSPLLIFGQDQVSMSWQKGPWTLRSAFLAESIREDHSYWLEGGWLPEKFEIHALVAYWWRQRTYGLSAATDIWGSTFRLESLFISPGEVQNPESQVQLGFGVERSLDEKWTAMIETFYQSVGVARSDEYRLASPSRFSPLRAHFYGAFQLSYQLEETVTLSAIGILNTLDGSVFAGFKVDKSLTENSNLLFELKGPLGASGGEFSNAAILLSPTSSLGVPTQASLSLKHFF